MNKRPSTFFRNMIAATGLAACLLTASATPPAALAQDQILNFRDADIRALINDVSLITGHTFIIDPRVRGNVTIVSQTPVPTDAVFDLFLSALRVYGFTAVPTATGAYKVLPGDAALSDGGAGLQKDPGTEQLVTRIFRLNFIEPLTALNTVKPLLHKDGRAIAHRHNDFLLVVDYASNIARLEASLRAIDKDTRQTKLITLRHSAAEQMAETVLALHAGIEGAQPSGQLSVVPVPSSNTLVLRGSSAVLDTILPLVSELDARSADRGDIRVIKLKYADAEDMKTMLDQVSRSLTPTGDGNGAAGGVSISFHGGTNTLVIHAKPDMQKTLEGVISQLDIPRAQVLVEAIIVEISDQAAKELGLQYVLSGTEGGNVPFSATNYSSTAPNILAATGALLLDDDFVGGENNGLSTLRQSAIDSLLGLNGFSAGIAGRSGSTVFGVIVNALEQDITSNILSTPSVMTLDNSEAKLLVGQEIPITTGEALGNNNSNPFRTIEREEVGISLFVRPQISDNGDIRLDIRQEVSSVQGTVGPTLGELITSKREIDTSIRVGDGEIIVLGGLIEQDERINLDKVPLLGDIPLLGELFKSESKQLVKTNLMVFIRPQIIRDAQSSRSATQRKFNLVREEQRKLNGTADIDVILEEVIGGAAIVPASPLENR